MPARSREITNTPTDARTRQIIRSILDQEVRRLLANNAALQALVDTNTSNISANAAAISANDDDIDTALQYIAGED